MSDLTIAKTILEQLGGRRFCVMTGARNIAGGERDLSFRLPTGLSRGINVVRVTIDPSDTYTVEFGFLRGRRYTLKSTHSDIYNDGLRSLFEHETGLATSLGTMAHIPLTPIQRDGGASFEPDPFA